MMKRLYKYAVILQITLILVFSYFNTFSSFENSLRDNIYQTGKAPDTRVVIVGIDEASLDGIGRWPWDRSVHAKVLDQISKGNPAAIGVDIIFSEPTEEDELLINSLKANDDIVFPVYGVLDSVTQANAMEAIELKVPLEEIRENVDLGHINVIPDEDGIMRKNMLYFDYAGERVESFPYLLYEKYMARQGQAKLEIEDIPMDHWNRTYIDFVGGPESMEIHSYKDVLEGNIPPEYFEDKIVLIGMFAKGVVDDYYYPSISHNSQMYGIEVHANVIQNLLTENVKKDLGFSPNAILILMLTVVCYALFNKISSIKSFIGMIVIMVGYVFMMKFCYKKGLLLQFIYPILAVLTTYLLVMVAKYIKEYLERRRVSNIFGKYVAPQIVNQILEGGEEQLALGGERKEITVFFLDVRGFTTMSENLEPEDVVKMLNKYLNIGAKAVFDNNGTLDKFIGDAIMAIYDAPLKIDNPELSAVKTALDIRREVAGEIGIGIGINTGFAIVGNIGAEFRMDYTAIGDSVNTAARLESNAKAGQILISEAVYERVKDQIEVEDLGTIMVKGKAIPLQIYNVLNLK